MEKVTTSHEEQVIAMLFEGVEIVEVLLIAEHGVSDTQGIMHVASETSLVSSDMHRAIIVEVKAVSSPAIS